MPSPRNDNRRRNAVPAVRDRPPAGIFGKLGGERAIGFVVEARDAECLRHLLGILALLFIGRFSLGDLGFRARARLPLVIAFRFGVAPRLEVIVRRQLQDQFPR